MADMAQRLRKLMDRVETWPEPAQEELVRSAFEIEMRYTESYTLTDKDRAALARSLDDVEHGRFASETEIAEVFARFRHA